MTRAGEKYVIEIGSEYGNSGSDGPKKLYRIKGFNSLIFDDEGLRRLTKYEPPEEKDVTIEEIQDAMIDVSEMSKYERVAALRIADFEGCMKYAMRNMRSFLKDVRNYRKHIEIGDEVKTKAGNVFVVTEMENELIKGYGVENHFIHYSCPKEDVYKTGRKFTHECVDAIKLIRNNLVLKGNGYD